VTRRRFVVYAAGAALAGCAAVGPDYGGPGPSIADRATAFPSSAAGPAPSAIAAQPPPESWWQLLHDPVLDELVHEALSANFDLQVAVSNVEAARAQLRAVGTRELPSVDATGALSEQRSATASQNKGQNADHPNPTTALGSFGLSLAWEIDLFGRVRRSVEAARAELGSLEAVRNNVMVSLLSTVASAYIDLRGAQLRRYVAEQNVLVQQQTLDLVLVLNKEGAATDFDVARARTQLLTSEATIPVFHAAATAARNRLTTLTGQPPGTLDAKLSTPQPLPQLPDLVAVGAPADLLRRRPDIQAAERSIAAASARIGVATADLFPTVSLIGTAGLAATPLSNLGASGAPYYALGPVLRWNLFDREALYARIAQADAEAAAAVNRYRATVTRALEEVDSAINAYRDERERREKLTGAVASSREASQLARLRYQEGVEDFLTVLDAQRNQLLVEEQLAASDIALAQDLIEIHRALGGGWENVEAPAYQPYAPVSAK
jgi:multidrug efflux system outer membrane protein